MLRIEGDEIGGSEVLTLEGKVTGPWVEQLRRSAGEALARGRGRLVLDLAGVSYIDNAGVGLLRELTERGVTFVNSSPFVRAQLGERP